MTRPFEPVVIAPTYNNAASLPSVLNGLESTGLPIIAVNDGSTDETSAILRQWQVNPQRRVVNHANNEGKATALRSGFDLARANGFTHAITIDTDGQLDPEDIPSLLALSQQNPTALVIGQRDASAADYPARSRWGRRISNFLVWLESGATIVDSQCGLRVYPLSMVGSLQCRAGHFGFETEIITRAAWAGVPIIGAPVCCKYLPVGERVSHFKPWVDSLRAVKMHAALLGEAQKINLRPNIVPSTDWATAAEGIE